MNEEDTKELLESLKACARILDIFIEENGTPNPSCKEFRRFLTIGIMKMMDELGMCKVVFTRDGKMSEEDHERINKKVN